MSRNRNTGEGRRMGRERGEDEAATPEATGRGDLLAEVAFDSETGLVPAIVQAAGSGRVLMLAYMNRDSLRRTLESGRVTFWSRSRGELWEKGETSGNRLDLVDLSTDCDGDALLVRARPRGPACHTGRASCFDAGRRFRPRRSAEAVEAPGAPLARMLGELVAVVEARDRERPEGSYTTRLLEGGPGAAARKVGEEAIETVLAVAEGSDRLAEESADLLYHLLVLWRAAGLDPPVVARVLEERRSGGSRSDTSPPDASSAIVPSPDEDPS